MNKKKKKVIDKLVEKQGASIPKKEVAQVPAAQVPTLDWKLGHNGISFLVNGSTVATMSKDRLLDLLSLKRENKLLDSSGKDFASTERERDFKHLDNVETWVRIARLLSKGLSFSHISISIDEDESLLRQFYQYRLGNCFNSNLVDSVEAEQSQAERDTVKMIAKNNPKVARSGAERPIYKFVKVSFVAQLLRQGVNHSEIAKRLQLDGQDFELFIKANQKYIEILNR